MAPRKKTIKGLCLSCGIETTKDNMLNHISTCATRDAAIAAANKTAVATTPAAERLFYLRVESLDEPEMWFDIEMQGAAKLSNLNQYLLAIWLDCGCYHPSYFSHSLESPGMSMADSIGTVFKKPHIKLFHSYDGQSSESLVTCKGVREGKPLTENPIVLLARNPPIMTLCKLCNAPSTQICTMCYDDPDEGVFCANHIHCSDHPCISKWDDVIMLPVMNSPRSGMCGYRGPAEPPY